MLPDPFHTEHAIGPSDRSFGILFASVFAVVGAWPWWQGGPPRPWAFVVGALFGLAAAVRPGVLAPLSRRWLQLGLLMHRVVNPVIMGALFYLVMTPFGLVRQVLNKGLTPRLRQDPQARTYWIDRATRPASRMDQQF